MKRMLLEIESSKSAQVAFVVIAIDSEISMILLI